ncbi:MAG: CPBP family glutamic-type intramembrane protease [Candidatus Nitrosoabyssus spongiisocia]|nr:MAG: CPBP family glutamic-type intramembrane protease [Nitrosopumilaceae archaeon AB1(1)]
MNIPQKLLQLLCIPYAALISILFGLMLLSFPLGIYLVFNADVDDNIHYDYIIGNVDLQWLVGFDLLISVGDAFTIIWCIFLGLFSISIFGRRANLLVSIKRILDAKPDVEYNTLIVVIKWFSILILVSLIVTTVQDHIGIPTEILDIDLILIQFYRVLIAPLVEEPIFRVLLIGVPLFLLYNRKFSFTTFFSFLWRPNLTNSSKSTIPIIIIISSIVFGLSHVLSGDLWTSGKFLQATLAGIILGWVYVHHGLICSILVHWATNYFIYGFALFVADTNSISVTDAFSHSLLNTLELLFVVTGILSVGIILLVYFKNKYDYKMH